MLLGINTKENIKNNEKIQVNRSFFYVISKSFSLF